MESSSDLIADYCFPLQFIISCLSSDFFPTNAINNATTNKNEENYCPTMYGLLRCFQRLPFGGTKTYPCPMVIRSGFNESHVDNMQQNISLHNVTTYCDPMTSTLKVHQYCVDASNKNTTTDYDIEVTGVKKAYNIMGLISRVGMSFSLVSLVIAIFLLSTLRRLHCMRVRIHLNLMISFLLRTVLWFLHIPAFKTERLNDPDEVVRILAEHQHEGDLHDIQNMYDSICLTKSHATCRAYTVIMHYITLANYFWILIEGFYLWILLRANTNLGKKTLICFTLFGWVGPVFPVFFYSYMYYDKGECLGVTSCNLGLYWIILAPQAFCLVANLVFFVLVIKMVASKLKYTHSLTSTTNNNRIKWRLAKATLSLLPLLGISYLTTIFLQCTNYKSTFVIALKFFEQSLQSLQGFFVSFIYCFCNSEVQDELAKLKRKWNTKKEIKRVTRTTTKLSTSAYDRSMLSTTVQTNFTLVSKSEHETLPMRNYDDSINSLKTNEVNNTEERVETSSLLSNSSPKLIDNH